MSDIAKINRRPGSGPIVIGPDIEVSVLGINEFGEVRIGILAPRQVEITTQEHLIRKQRMRDGRGGPDELRVA